MDSHNLHWHLTEELLVGIDEYNVNSKGMSVLVREAQRV